MRRYLVSLFVLSLALATVGPIQAQEGTPCRHEMVFTLSPGISVNPTTGIRHGKGTITCDGPVDGKQPTGPGTVTDKGRYGTEDPDSCISGSEGDGTDFFEIPTTDGILKIESFFVYDSIQPSTKGAILSADFRGTRYTGNIEMTPMEGDCFTAPVTRLKGFGEGILHPERKVS